VRLAVAVSMPWITAPRNLRAGEKITIGREAGVDLEFEVGEDVRAGTLLGVDSADGRFHPVTSTNTRRTRK
jgi:hypothetical protein